MQDSTTAGDAPHHLDLSQSLVTTETLVAQERHQMTDSIALLNDYADAAAGPDFQKQAGCIDDSIRIVSYAATAILMLLGSFDRAVHTKGQARRIRGGDELVEKSAHLLRNGRDIPLLSRRRAGNSHRRQVCELLVDADTAVAQRRTNSGGPCTSAEVRCDHVRWVGDLA